MAPGSGHGGSAEGIPGGEAVVGDLLDEAPGRLVEEGIRRRLFPGFAFADSAGLAVAADGVASRGRAA